MRNIIAALVFAACLSLSLPASAVVPPVVAGSALSPSVGIVATPFNAVAIMVAPLVLTALVAENVDPWHPLACTLFGNEGRVGNDTDSACNH